jgi:hypothetical protein
MYLFKSLYEQMCSGHKLYILISDIPVDMYKNSVFHCCLVITVTTLYALYFTFVFYIFYIHIVKTHLFLGNVPPYI